MGNIARSTGKPIGSGTVVYGMAGGGYRGLTPELDALVLQGAEALAGAYRMDITVRFNSDRESGGAFLVTHEVDDIGSNGEVGIGASLTTARCRAVRERFAREAVDDEDREYWESALRNHPEGQITVYAHVATTSADPRRLAELRTLPGWMDMGGSRDGYHHGAADSVAEALQRCLRFAPPSSVLRPGKG